MTFQEKAALETWILKPDQMFLTREFLLQRMAQLFESGCKIAVHRMKSIFPVFEGTGMDREKALKNSFDLSLAYADRSPASREKTSDKARSTAITLANFFLLPSMMFLRSN